MPQLSPPKNPDNKPSAAKYADALRYAGMGTQLLVLLGLAVWAGLWLDEKTGWKVPVFLIVLPLIALFHFLYRLIKTLNSKSK